MFEKLIDRKLEQRGFKLIEETKFGAYYEKEHPEHRFTQAVHILNKASGKHLIQSYDTNTLQADGRYINEACGVEAADMGLFVQKAKKLAKKYNWETATAENSRE